MSHRGEVVKFTKDDHKKRNELRNGLSINFFDLSTFPLYTKTNEANKIGDLFAR